MEGHAIVFLPVHGVRAGFASLLRRLKAIQGERRAGQSMIEFAFTLVIILILLVGLIDLGRAIFTYLALRDAAQEGASYASYNPPVDAITRGNIALRACNSSTMVNSLCNDPVPAKRAVTISELIGSACNGNGVRVSVTYTSTLVTPFLGALVGRQTIPIRASVTDTILSPPCH
jgi:Flp pilus assembly protein TadG